MYSYIYLSLIILGLFSIFENIKGGQKLSFIKLNFILLLTSITLACSVDFLNEIGYELSLFGSIFRVTTTILIINVFQLMANKKLSKIVIIIEILVFIIYFISILNGYRFADVVGGNYNIDQSVISAINAYVINPLFIASMSYCLYKILKSTDENNLYQRKIKKWSILLSLLNISIFFTVVITFILYTFDITFKHLESRRFFIIYRLILILFIFFRPKFIDEMDFSFKKLAPLARNSKISLQNFEFLFYINQYFLKSDANLEDFALLLNHSKTEVSDFIKNQTNDSFVELVSKNRINYFKELLRTKQHESFTIEALSEMSGFNNRQSMYNAFNKYEGCSPSEYISNM